MMQIKIIIDGEPYEIKGNGVTVKDLLILGQKPESRLENYELIQVVKGEGDKEGEVLIYSKKEKKGSLDIPVSVKDEDYFLIRSDTVPTPAS